jgi:hypothetical protein
VLDLVVEIDGLPVPMDDVRVCLAGERLPLAQLVDAEGWWFLQDRLLLAGPRTRSLTVPPGQDHDVEVSMRLLLPYLESPSGGPAVLPFRCARRLGVNAVSARGAFRDVR